MKNLSEQILDKHGNRFNGLEVICVPNWENLTSYNFGQYDSNFRIAHNQIAKALLFNIKKLALRWSQQNLINLMVFDYNFDETRLARWLFDVHQEYSYLSMA